MCATLSVSIKTEENIFLYEVKCVSTFSINNPCLIQKKKSMQDAYVKQTLMRIMKITWQMHMEMMHDKKFNDL